MERRRMPRIRCSVACSLVVDGKSVEASVRNVSDAGLGVDAPLASAHEGDSVAVSLKPPGCAQIRLRATVWHARAVRRARGGEPFAQLGLVLSEANDDYFRFLASLRPARSEDSGLGAARPAGCRFAVQVARSESSRTRRILVMARDAEAAAARALAEAGTGWSVVEVRPARATH